MNVIFLFFFGHTLFLPPPMIYRFAALMDKSILSSPWKKRITAYCRKVTIVWCGFFLLNGSIAVYTAFFGSNALWSLYNGVIANLLMGILFAGEFIVRKKVQKKIPEPVPLSAFKKKSRNPSLILCYDGAWSEGRFKTWEDFIIETAKLRAYIKASDNGKPQNRWLLHCEDYWYFLLAFTALLQCKKEVLLSANISPGYINEIRGTTNSTVPFLTDQILPGKQDFIHIPALLAGGEPRHGASLELSESEEIPAINADETSIILFTSGSTGKAKAVKQRLTELENDNRFALSMWGEEFLRRKVCSTVSQHHIYGLLFSILLPFAAGIPFRRERIQFPEELEKLSDTEYMLITVPAFLKRATAIEKNDNLKLKSPFIITSGGALSPDTAKKTNEILGFWPLEIYGSTETSGIAWRQSVDGPEWNPFSNARINKNKDGCLTIRSPYIKNPDGFETADLADIYPDGRFILRGRNDSVVKIEEKRISLIEVQDRILQSGLVAEVSVIPLEGKRQYLAAAIVFNAEGKKRFFTIEKNNINKFWREYLLQFFENIVIPKKWLYLDVLPSDAQGKRNLEAVKLLFHDKSDPEPRSADAAWAGQVLACEGSPLEKVIEKTENSVTLEFSVPGTSPYFDGHFPEFKILPAVAQTELVIRYSARFLGTGINISEMKRTKFLQLIRPDTPLVIHLEKKEKTISFKIISPDEKTVYSAGVLVLPVTSDGA